jgi:outer membrane lipoprotein carrier protein
VSQKWFRLKCIRPIATAIIGIGLANPIWALTDKVPASDPIPNPISTPKTKALNKARPIPKLLKEIETKYSHAKTLSAQFIQTNQSITFAKPKVSSGKIFVKRPSKFRWETLKPDPNLVITDKNHVLYYTPPFDENEPGQIIERNVSEVQSRLVNALLSGSFSVARDLRIEQKDPTHFILIPKKGTAATVKTAEIEIDPVQKLIQKIALIHHGGSTSEIQLSQIELGKPLQDDLFEFTPPPNTSRPDVDS